MPPPLTFAVLRKEYRLVPRGAPSDGAEIPDDHADRAGDPSNLIRIMPAKGTEPIHERTRQNRRFLDGSAASTPPVEAMICHVPSPPLEIVHA
jgi:hypothetical protein